LAGARTVSVRSAFDDESNRRIFKAPPLPPAANRDGSRSGHFKLSHYPEIFAPGVFRLRRFPFLKKPVR
jgi:hypothetical protein